MKKCIKIKQLSEREIWINESKIKLEEDNIIYDVVVGAPDENIAIKEIEVILKLANLVEGKVNLIVDLNDAGTPTINARIKYRKLVENSKLLKVALIGVHPLTKVLASFVIAYTSKKEIRFLKTKKEAIMWFEKN